MVVFPNIYKERTYLHVLPVARCVSGSVGYHHRLQGPGIAKYGNGCGPNGFRFDTCRTPYLLPGVPVAMR